MIPTIHTIINHADISGSLLNSLSNFLLSPISLFCGRTYSIIYHKNGNLANILADNPAKTAWHVAEVVKKIFTSLMLITVVPVLLGLVLRVIALQESKVHQAFLHIHASQGHEVLSIEGLSYKPHTFDIETTLQEAISINPNQLLNIWDTVGKQEENGLPTPSYFDRQEEIKDFLAKHTILNNYSGILPENKQAAMYQVRNMLKIITHHLMQPQTPYAIKKTTLLQLIEAFSSCPPTWVEETHKIARKLCVKNNEVQDEVLSKLQEMKEENILKETQVNNNEPQWHVLNYIRYHHGNQFGLNTDNLRFDRYFFMRNFSKYSALMTKNILLREYTLPRVIQTLEDHFNSKINPQQGIYSTGLIDYFLPILKAEGMTDLEAIEHCENHFFRSENIRAPLPGEKAEYVPQKQLVTASGIRKILQQLHITTIA